MAPQRLTRAARRQLTRDALLDAATRVFARRGYEAGTLEEISEAAGFTTGAVYSNFGSKHELFLAVLERRNAELTEQYGRLLAPQGSSPASLSDIATYWSQREAADQHALRLTLELRLAALRDPLIRKHVADFERRTEDAITRFVADRVGEIAGPHGPSVPIEDFAVVVHAASQGLLQHMAVCGTDHSELFETFLSLVTAGLAPARLQADAQ